MPERRKQVEKALREFARLPDDLVDVLVDDPARRACAMGAYELIGMQLAEGATMEDSGSNQPVEAPPSAPTPKAQTTPAGPDQSVSRFKRFHPFLDTFLELVIIALICWEIRIGYREIRFSYQAAKDQEQQVGLLRQTLQAAQQQATTLEKMMSAQRQAADDLVAVSDLAHRQLTEMARRPRLMVRAGGVSLKSKDRPIPTKSATPTSTVLELQVWNEGTAIARAVFIRVGVTNSAVSLSCEPPCDELKTAIGTSGRAWFVRLDRFQPKSMTVVTVTLFYPTGSPPFDLWVNAEADNFERTELGRVRISPSKEPPSPAPSPAPIPYAARRAVRTRPCRSQNSV